MKKRIKLHVFLFLVASMSTCVEINTSTPQASGSILSSKQSGFYLSSTVKINSGALDLIDSVWSEKVWRYDIIDGKKEKIPLFSNQIVLRLKKGEKLFNKKDYFIKWRISEKSYGDLASGNGVFIKRYSKNDRIDTLQFTLHTMVNNSLKDIGTFLVR